MKNNGLQVIDVNSETTVREFVATGKSARQSLVGKLYDQAFLDRVEKTVADYRAKHGGSK